MKQKVICDKCKRIYFNKVKVEQIKLQDEDKPIYAVYTYKHKCPVCKCTTGKESFVDDDSITYAKAEKKCKK